MEAYLSNLVAVGPVHASAEDLSGVSVFPGILISVLLKRRRVNCQAAAACSYGCIVKFAGGSENLWKLAVAVIVRARVIDN
jgi:hypothetical protein